MENKDTVVYRRCRRCKRFVDGDLIDIATGLCSGCQAELSLAANGEQE